MNKYYFKRSIGFYVRAFKNRFVVIMLQILSLRYSEFFLKSILNAQFYSFMLMILSFFSIYK